MTVSDVVRRTSRSGVTIAGVVVLVIGLAGIATWALLAGFASSYGSVAAESTAGQIAEVGYEDPVDDPDTLTGTAADGTVVWEGTQAEYDLITEEGRAAYQAELRRDWLYAPAVITAFGLLVLAIGAVRGGRGPDSP